ncbi:PREDICTED: 2'-5'-oligoadenylate synthase-like protein 2-like [Chrysochloris asiatica]|uniref:2'-5' oligoadenylate synthase n=1 Tax=Chrysochloris asiatica TaxID=185453 RepID=A0A9B0WSQ3_CHRAS|nr:PREDICTED: 2'-5'-oligoadenylate synthase-like protein 2-like [Chrysochloris asiatica]
MAGPIILDPADPTNNLAKGKRWDLVAKEAVHCLRQTCCYIEDPSRGWQVQDLYETPADRLDAFVGQSLQPQWERKKEMQDAWQRIVQFLRDKCFQDELILDREIKVLKVVKAGSSGKGTTLKCSSDVDLVLFLSCFYNFKEQAQYREVIIRFIQEKLDHCSRSLAYNISLLPSRVGARAPRSLSLQVQARKSSEVIQVDVLPAFNALGSFCPGTKPSPEIYEDLIKSDGHPGEFSSSFTELQKHFVKSCPPKVKSLLRLVKHWQLQYLKSKHRKVPLPSKYALELLTIYAWEMGTDESDNFEMDEAFVAVMKLLRDHEDICIYWTKYYDFQNEVVRSYIKHKLKECRPIILDPADPTNNLAKGKRWDLVAKEAVRCLRQACCYIEDPSRGWQVQRAREIQVTVKKTGEEAKILSVNPYSLIWKTKTRIKNMYDITGNLRLSFQEPDGNRQPLSSRKTLADYGIFSKVGIRVLEVFPPEIQVFVKESGDQNKPYAIDPDDSIWVLKEKIEAAGGPYVDDQILKFQGRKLKNHHSLRDLQIKDCDTIMLIRRD